MKLNLIATKEILDFEKEIGRELVVNERRLGNNDTVLARYYVHFEGAEVMSDNCLIGEFGNGNTIDGAIKDYCIKVSNRKIVFGAYMQDRKEVQFPKLVHTKLLAC